MKSTKLFLFSFALAALVFTSCSKDKKLEKLLHKKEGTWTIGTATYVMTVTDTASVDIVTTTAPVSGTFTFDKGGSGSYSFTINSEEFNGNFNWIVSDESIALTGISIGLGGLFGGSTNVSVFQFAAAGEQIADKEITLNGSEQITYVDGSVSVRQLAITNMSLTKQ